MLDTNQYYKELEQLSYYVNDSRDVEKPHGFHSVKTYENPRTGFKAEAFVNEHGKKFLIYAGTRKTSGKDLLNDFSLMCKRIPQQANDAYLAYEDFNNRYGDGEITVSGYSLGGSLTQIICNETGAKGITFAAYGVGDIVSPKYTAQITNIGHQSDPIFNANIKNQIGESYMIPDERDLVYKGSSFSKHMPNKMGEISKAIKINNLQYDAGKDSNILDGYINKNYYDDSLFDISNKVIYNSGDLNLCELSSEEIDLMLNQYEENGQSFPSKEDMERRVRFGELLYVENYTRSDGTKVSGYYRRYPQR